MRDTDSDIRLQLVHRETFTSTSPMTADEAVRILRDLMVDLDREWLCVINMDANEKPINFYITSTGNINCSLASAMQTFKTSLLCNAKKIMLLHNHPSGSVEPSGEDRDTTVRFSAAGKLLNIELVDHLIIGGGNGKIYSIERGQEIDIDQEAEEEIPKSKIAEKKDSYHGKQYSIEDYTFENVDVRVNRNIQIPENLLEKHIDEQEDALHIMHPILINQKPEELIAVYLDNQKRPVTYQILPQRSRMSNGGVKKMLRHAILNNCNNLLLFSKIKPHGTITKSDEEYTRRMVGCARLLEIDLLDHFFTSDIGEHYNMRSYNGRLFTKYFSQNEIEQLTEHGKLSKVGDAERRYGDSVSETDTNQREEKMKFGEIKHQLAGKLIPIQGNEEKLQRRPYKKLADFALVYGVEKDDGTIRGVDNKDLESMGMSEKEFVEKADAAIADNHPSFLFSMYDFMDIEKQPQNAMPGLYMATSSMYGASVIGYPEFLTKAAKIMGSNYYIIPSSVNEVLLIKEPYVRDLSADRLDKIVRKVNDTLTPENILTEKIYHYSSAENILETADEYDERQRTVYQEEDIPDESEMDDPDTIDQDIQAAEMEEENMEDIDYIDDYDF